MVLPLLPKYRRLQAHTQNTERHAHISLSATYVRVACMLWSRRVRTGAWCMERRTTHCAWCRLHADKATHPPLRLSRVRPSVMAEDGRATPGSTWLPRTARISSLVTPLRSTSFRACTGHTNMPTTSYMSHSANSTQPHTQSCLGTAT